MNKYTLNYYHVGLSSFVKKDIQILSEEFELNVFLFDQTKKSKLPFSFIKQFFHLLFKSKNVKGYVIQFAGYHSFLPVLVAKLMRKKSIIILGGTDCVGFPSIKYGCFYNKNLKHFTKISLKKANLLLPVSETLVFTDYSYNKDDYPHQGYKYFIPNIKTNHITIPNGYDSKKWENNIEKIERTFITIAADLGSRFGVKLKGIDLILDAAQLLSNCTFYIVGGNKIQQQLPDNVIPIENLPHEELPKFIGNKQFYLQLSMSEGFPNALCEAMLSGCVPIVSNVGAMPVIVSDKGYILKEKNKQLLVDLINLALNEYSIEKSKEAVKQIKDNFTIENRKQMLNSAIKNLF